jgi:hypothetical protein
VTRADCQVSVNHDLLVKIVEIEPQSRAMAITFRGQPTARFLRAPRVEVPFFSVSSEIFEKTEQELLAYEMPITKIVEQNAVKDLGEVTDREWLQHVEAGCQALQLEANGGVPRPLNFGSVSTGAVVEFSIRKGELARTAGTNDATPRPVQRPDFVQLAKMLDGRRLKSDLFLMTETDFDDVLQWTVEDFGDRLQSETTVEGYKYNLLFGRKYVRTIKTDILRPGNIYVFTAKEFFGKFYILNQTKFYIDKIANLIKWQAWRDIGMLLANVAAVCKLETYSGDANPQTNADNLLDVFIPVAEDALGAMNNRVDAGLKFPQVSQF